MFPFVASQALALQQAKQKRKPANAEPRRTNPNAHVPPMRRGLLQRLLDVVVRSRRREADVDTRG